MRYFILGFGLLLVAGSCQKAAPKAVERLSQIEKTAYFIDEERLLVIAPTEAFIFNFSAKARSKPLYKPQAGAELFLPSLRNGSRALSDNRETAALFEQSGDGSANGKLIVLSLNSGEARQFVCPVMPAGFGFNQNFFFSFWPNGRYFRLNLASGESESLNIQYSFAPQKPLLAAALLNNGLLAAFSRDMRLTVQTQTGTVLQSAAAPAKGSFSLSQPAGSGTLALAGAFGLQLAQTHTSFKTDKFLKSKPYHKAPLLALSADAALTAVLSANRLTVYNNKTGALVWEGDFFNKKQTASSLDFSPSNNLLLAGGARKGQIGSLFIYNLQTGRLADRILGSNDKPPHMQDKV